MSSKICSVEHCYSTVRTAGLCVAHYKAEQRRGTFDAPDRPTCKMTGCNSKMRFKELCGRHYQIEQRANVKRAQNECAVKPCPVEVYREGHCKAHYVERYPKVQTRIPDCRRPGCTQPQFRLEGCVRHWKIYQNNQLRRTIVPCSEPGCQAKTFALGRCQLHHNQFKNAENYPDDLWSFVKQELGIKA